MLPGYVPLAGRWKAAKIVLWVAVALAVVAIVSDALLISWYSRSEVDMDDEGMLFNGLRASLVGLLQLLAFVGGAIAFLIWLSRAYANLDPVEPGHRRYGPGWDIASWFIPLLNWYRPPKILNDVVKGGNGGDKSTLVGFWWTAFWIAGLFNFVATTTTSPEYLDTAAVEMLISDLFIVISGLLLIKIGSEATARLDTRAWSKAQSLAPREGGRFDRASTLFPTEVTS